MRWWSFVTPKERFLAHYKVMALLLVGLFYFASAFAPIAYAQRASAPIVSSGDIEVNEDVSTAYFSVTLTGPYNGDVNVDYYTQDISALDGQDYVGIKGSIVFKPAPGSQTQVVPISIIYSLSPEPTEQFALYINSQQVKVPQNTYIATINDVVPPPTTTPPAIGTPVRPRPTTHSPDPEPTLEPIPEPESTISTVPEVLSFTTPTPPPAAPDISNTPERSVFVKSVPTPQDLKLTAERVIRAILIAALLVLLIMFPADLFNSTLQGNYDEIIGWFKMDYIGKLHRKMQLHKIPIAIVLSVFAGLVTLLNTQLSPDFGFNRASAALLLGMFVALTFAATVYDLSRALYLKKRFGLSGKLRAHALGLGVGALFVTISRLAHFVPGYLYGLFTGLIFKQRGPTDKQDGEGLAISSVLILFLAVAGWFALIPVRSISTQPDASFIALVTEAALATLWVSALGMIVFSLVPMRFMYGEQVKKWNKYGWAAIYGCGMLLFVYTLLDPNQSVYGKSATASWISVLSLFIGFGLFSLTFWAYFRYRPTRPQPKKQTA